MMMTRETMMTIAMTMPMTMTIAMEVTYIKNMMTNVNGGECNDDEDYPLGGIMTNNNDKIFESNEDDDEYVEELLLIS